MAATGLYSAAPGGSSSGPGAPGGPQTGNQQQNQVQTDYNRSRSPGRELDDHPAGNYYQGYTICDFWAYFVLHHHQ